MGKLSTHILDIANGQPAAGVGYRLLRLTTQAETTQRTEIRSGYTNADGRTDMPLLKDAELLTGTYELEFDVADYYRAMNHELPTPAFIEVAVIRFGIADAETSYHVPLLMSPWSYSTYRGS